MNKFYSRSKLYQWFWALTLSLVGVLLMAIPLVSPYISHSNWGLFAFPLFILLMPIFQFVFTPILTLMGTYKYVSPMLLVYQPNPAKYDIHAGTPFDFFMVFNKKQSRWEKKRIMMRQFIEGMLEIIREIESEELPETVQIRGASYFFSEKTAERFGFRLKPIHAREKFNLLMNVVDIWILYGMIHSFAKFPPFNQFKAISITGKELVKRKSLLEETHRRFSK